jgi:hypothetical protein
MRSLALATQTSKDLKYRNLILSFCVGVKFVCVVLQDIEFLKGPSHSEREKRLVTSTCLSTWNKAIVTRRFLVKSHIGVFTNIC